MGSCWNGVAVAGSDRGATARLAARRDHEDFSQKHAGVFSSDNHLNKRKNFWVDRKRPRAWHQNRAARMRVCANMVPSGNRDRR